MSCCAPTASTWIIWCATPMRTGWCIDAPGTAQHGLFARDADGRPLCWDRTANAALAADSIDISPMVVGESTCCRTAGARDRCSSCRRALPRSAGLLAGHGQRNAAACRRHDIRRLARELASAAFDHAIELPIAWTDTLRPRSTPSMIGRPVAMHAMRGISAHSNGFQTCRALHLLQLLLGAVDAPGSFRYQPPFPRPIPPANRPGKTRDADGRLERHAARLRAWAGRPAGRCIGPAAPYRSRLLLAVSAGRARHDAHRDPQCLGRRPVPIDVLMLFMANMSWNSAMNTHETLHWLTDKDAQRRVPDSAHHLFRRLFQRDGAPTPTWSCPTRPISSASMRSSCSIGRFPTPTARAMPSGIRCCRTPDRDVRGFQSVLFDLGARLGLPAMVHADGSTRYAITPITSSATNARPGVGLLAGWRGVAGRTGRQGCAQSGPA